MVEKYELELAPVPEMVARDAFSPLDQWPFGEALRTPVIKLPPGQQAAICRSSAIDPLQDACPFTIQRQQNGGPWVEWGASYKTAEAALNALQIEINF